MKALRKRRNDSRGFTTIEAVVGILLLGILAVGMYNIMINTNQGERMGTTMSEAQQNARSALDLILKDLREAGYGIDQSTDVPIEVASEYRITMVIDNDTDGVIEPGERITYFLDKNGNDPLVANTDNPHDYVLRRVISSVADSSATPGSGLGQVVAYGITQMDPDLVVTMPDGFAGAANAPITSGSSWNTRMFNYFDASGTSLLGTATDPTDAAFGLTVSDANLGKPAATATSNVHSVRVDLVAEGSHRARNSKKYPSVRVSGTIFPRNLNLSSAGSYASNVTPPSDPPADDPPPGDPPVDDPPPEEPPVEDLPPVEPPIRIPTERVLSLTMTDLNELDSQEGSNVTSNNQHDYDIIVGTAAGGSRTLNFWFEAYPDKYPQGIEQGSYYNSIANYFGNTPRDVQGLATGDINADGFDDAVAAVRVSDTSGGFETWINQAYANQGYLGVGTTTTAPNSYFTNSTGSGTDIALADFDQDGDLDVALSTRTGDTSGKIEIWLNNGAGVFTRVTQVSGQGRVMCIVAADFDGDGRLDVAAGSRTHDIHFRGSIEVWRSTGGGGLTSLGNWNSSGAVNDLVAASMNLGGTVDLVVGVQTASTAGRVELWLNDGLGAMTLGDYAPADGGVLSVGIGPLDPDNSSPDIVAGTTARSVQAWFCNAEAANASDIIPQYESWADANAGGEVHALAVRKVEASVNDPYIDRFYDVVCGTSINASSGEIVIYLNPYVWTLNP